MLLGYRFVFCNPPYSFFIIPPRQKLLKKMQFHFVIDSNRVVYRLIFGSSDKNHSVLRDESSLDVFYNNEIRSAEEYRSQMMNDIAYRLDHVKNKGKFVYNLNDNLFLVMGWLWSPQRARITRAELLPLCADDVALYDTKVKILVEGPAFDGDHIMVIHIGLVSIFLHLIIDV